MVTIKASLSPSEYKRDSEGMCSTQTTQRPRGRVLPVTHLVYSHTCFLVMENIREQAQGAQLIAMGLKTKWGTFSVCYKSYSHHRRGTREQGFPAKPLLTHKTHQHLLSCLL